MPTTTSSADLDRLVGIACERDTQASFVIHRADGEVDSARARLLEIVDDFILADEPVRDNKPVTLPAGRPVTVHVSINGLRYEFDTEVVDPKTWVQINQAVRVRGVVLRKPTAIHRSERRSSFRVSLAAVKPILVDLVRGDPKVRDACLLGPDAIQGRLVNLSAGGMAVLFQRGAPPSARRNDRFFASFGLPGVDEPFCLLAEVRHNVVVKASESVRIAFAFRPWGGRRMSQDQRLITRFITEEERRQLRMRK